MTHEAPSPAPSKRTLLGFPGAFWSLNGIEAFERLAYFGVRAVVAIYIMQADLPGGLHFTAAQKGTIYAWWFVFQSVLPVITGGLADRYGYKNTLFVSITMNIAGYCLMATMTSFWGFFWAVMLLASGTALFKPALQGSLSQTIPESRSSMGWGIFYWMVNIGATVAPLAYSVIRDSISWPAVFFTSAAVTSLNYLMLLTYRRIGSGSDTTDGLLVVLSRTVRNILEPRLVAWLLIMSCFWLMMYQVWDLHPNLITDGVDGSAVPTPLHLPAGWTGETGRGVQVNQEILLTLNPALIIALMIPISWAVRRLKTLQAMVIGMAMATAGVIITGFSTAGWLFLGGIVFFSLGEMLTGPKKNEYLSLIAPPGKKAMYLGYVNIPVGIGGFVGSKLAGYLYGHYGDRAVLSQKYLFEHSALGAGKTWSGDPDELSRLIGIERTGAFDALQDHLGIDAPAAVDLLWTTYQPHLAVWIPMASIGVLGIVALVIFNWRARSWTDMNV